LIVNGQKKRIQAVADAVLAAEVKRTTDKLPSMLPDSALFADDAPKKKKKKKIILQPLHSNVGEQKTADVEYFDVWGDPAIARAAIPRPPPMNRKSHPPTSEDSYRSQTHVRPPPPVEESEEVISVPSADSGMGDLLAGDVINAPTCAVEFPPRPKKEKSDVVIRAHIPKYLPDAQKREMHEALRNGHRILRERQEAKTLPEFERTLEIAAELEAERMERSNRPKKEKEDSLLRFIPDEPEYRVDERPERLSDAPADQRPFSRLERSFEVRRKVGLRE
jgi:hypothetical protein